MGVQFEISKGFSCTIMTHLHMAMHTQCVCTLEQCCNARIVSANGHSRSESSVRSELRQRMWRWEPDLQLADAGHGAGQQHQEHPRRQGAAAVARSQAVDRQVRGYQRGGTGCMGADAGSSQPESVRDAADEEIHAVAGGHVGRDLHPQPCTHTMSEPVTPLHRLHLASFILS